MHDGSRGSLQVMSLPSLILVRGRKSITERLVTTPSISFGILATLPPLTLVADNSGAEDHPDTRLKSPSRGETVAG
jgi:hypothetical protein